ncbi:MAG TPA: rod shape-determining protein MreC [Oscillatoriaceae cyanobacterium M33_DOE_052]|uniref:Cell shape-determining protein MreC n=1 Tax=Planktothricoides sp. SpSt-374 TaxID=2282167 RepID=A0A7C3ZPC0_9CYAN|nr:rod shape-determining protein MreC [Oscillatoriaceae cyanobacterium M33_DOE_052]
MYTLRRWWGRHSLQVGLVALAIGAAGWIRFTEAQIVFEAYQWIVRPFQGEQQPELIDAKIRELQLRLEEVERQNQKLKELLGYVEKQKPRGIVAPVVGRSSDQWWQHVTLGRGSKDGIRPDYIVTGPGGLVGRILSVTPHSSKVLLITDPAFRVGVAIARTRHMGVLRGTSAELVDMEFFDKLPNVRVGDTVSTSNLSQAFPPGLPVGKVFQVNLTKSPAPVAVVELSADISSLEWVVVSPNQEARAQNGANTNTPPKAATPREEQQ